MVYLKETDQGIEFKVKIQPRASTNEITGTFGDAFKLRITAPPVEGAANEAVIKFLKKLFGVSQGDVTISSGLTSRNKIIRVTGITLSEAKIALGYKC